jgi:hypothetical protein
MKKLIATAVAIAAPLALAPPADAYAGTPGCVTRAEYRSVTDGMTQAQVATRFGIARKPVYGRITYRYESSYMLEVDREYRVCNAAGKPRTIDNGSVEVWSTKESDDDGNMPSGPLRSSYKSYVSY